MQIDPIDHNNSSEMDPMYIEHTMKRKRRTKHKANVAPVILLIFFVIVLVTGYVLLTEYQKRNRETDVVSPPTPTSKPSEAPTATEVIIEDVKVEEPKFLHETDQTVFLDDEFPSKYAILIDAQSGEILAERNSYEFLNPASMTKVLTLLVAVENITEIDGTFTMTREISEYCFVNECSVVGYIVGETVPIDELFYGCILCSGADASLALAELAAGSHEKFVTLMNEKLDELGISDSAHFTNCVGVYDEEHGCSSADMALIMKAALENEKCREILCTKVYNSAPTAEHPDGQVFSNWFVRSLEDKNNGEVNVLGGKRGYVPESGNCAVSYGETETGKSYICVTGKSYSQKQAIDDHAALYEKYCHS